MWLYPEIAEDGEAGVHIQLGGDADGLAHGEARMPDLEPLGRRQGVRHPNKMKQ